MDNHTDAMDLNETVDVRPRARERDQLPTERNLLTIEAMSINNRNSLAHETLVSEIEQKRNYKVLLALHGTIFTRANRDFAPGVLHERYYFYGGK